MARFTGRATFSIAGNQTIVVGFQPTWANFKVCANNAGTDAVSHWSEGDTDGTNQNFNSTFSDGAGHSRSRNGNTKVLEHYEYSGGAFVTVLSTSFVSFTPTGITLNNAVPSSNYKVVVTCGN